MILRNLIAIIQTNMKRILAYSFISQIGYIIIRIVNEDSNYGYPIIYLQDFRNFVIKFDSAYKAQIGLIKMSLVDRAAGPQLGIGESHQS